MAEKNPTETPMGRRSVQFLVAYLVFIASLCAYVISALASAEPHKTIAKLPPADCATATTPAVTHVSPDELDAGAPADVWLVGCGFTASTG